VRSQDCQVSIEARLWTAVLRFVCLLDGRNFLLSQKSAPSLETTQLPVMLSTQLPLMPKLVLGGAIQLLSAAIQLLSAAIQLLSVAIQLLPLHILMQ
jgi:hypothetical protein